MCDAPMNLLLGPSRKKIDDWLQNRVRELGFDIDLPAADSSFFDFCYDINSHRWTHWEDTASSFIVPKGATYENIVVPTLDSIRLSYSISTLLLNGHPVICPGPTGTGKTVVLTELLLLSLPENFEAHLMSFSAHTRVNQVQVGLEFEKRE